MTAHGGSAFAVLTAPGRGGIAVVRAVGPGVEKALSACFRPAGSRSGLPPPGGLAYGHIVDDAGAAIDEIILHHVCEAWPAEHPACGAAAPAGRVVAYEINCHGGPAAVAAVGARLAALGLAEVDADSLLEVQGAGLIERRARGLLRRLWTTTAAAIVLDQLNGALAAAVRTAGDDLTAGRNDSARRRLDELLGWWRRCGRRLADPPRIVIAGRPNAGKSTLFNRLLEADRALVSHVPGTTRDYIEAEASLCGLPAVLVDTAGFRPSADPVEVEGVARAADQAASADLVVYLLDATEGRTAADASALADLGGRALQVWNKVDVQRPPWPDGAEPSPAILVSALTGSGVDVLVSEILLRLDYAAPPAGAAVPFAADLAELIEQAAALLEQGRPKDAAEALRAID